METAEAHSLSLFANLSSLTYNPLSNLYPLYPLYLPYPLYLL